MSAEQPKTLSKEERELFIKSTFEPVKHLKDLPLGVQSALGVNEKKRRIADAGGDFSAGCTGGPDIPHQRFIFGGTSGDRCFVYYEQGGIARFLYFQLYKISGDKAELVYQAMNNKDYKNVDDIKKAMTAKEMQY